MHSTITENDWRGKMLGYKKSPAVIEGMELIDVLIADLEREKAEQMKKAAVEGRLGLRNRLRKLVSAILSQTPVRGKGAASDASQ